ncbi:MAG: hypothetical protein WCS92_03655 [Candidatus Babeliales bacterium]
MKKVIKYLYFPIFLGFFAFASTNLWSATQKPADCAEAALAHLEAQVRQEFTELMYIIELRADAIFYAISESIDRNALAKQIPSYSSTSHVDSLAKIDLAKKQTRDAINAASTAYLMTSENVKSRLDRLEQIAHEKGAFTYNDIERIVAKDVLKSEKIHSKDCSDESIDFQFRAIEEILSIQGLCQEMCFICYIDMIWQIHKKTAALLKTESHDLFLEIFNTSSGKVGNICNYLFAAHLRNIIDVAFRSEIIVPSTPVKYSSAKIEAHRKKRLAEVAKEREAIHSRLLTIDEIKAMILQQIGQLPEKLKARILELANPGNSQRLIHYVQVWGAIAGPEAKKNLEIFFLSLNSEFESLKKIFSGIDLKSEVTGTNPKNILPNLIAKLTEYNFEFLIKDEAGCSKAAAESKEHRELTQAELKAEQMAKDLIAAEDTAKKQHKTKKQKAAAKQATERSKAAAKRKEEEAPSVTVTPKIGSSKQKQKHKGQDAPSVVETLRHKAPELLASTSSPAPAVPSLSPESLAPDLTIQIQDPEIEETLKLGVAESQSGQELFEPENPQDQISKKYNCILDLSRGTTGYQCKIFLHPEAAGSSVNFLANLDYSRLPKYKNPRDNNHAFSNLVEKHYGNLGVISSQRSTGNGWIVIRITFPGRITWIGHEMANACQLPPNGTFEFVIMKRDMNPNSYACCVHRFFRPN